MKNRLKTTFPNIRFEDKKRAEEELKLICTKDNATVKIEVNQINRGLIAELCTKILCNRAEEEFDRFCEIKTVSVGQLNAALERQHPININKLKQENPKKFRESIKKLEDLWER